MTDLNIDKWLICRICLKNENKKLYSIYEPISEEEITDLGTTLQDKIELCGSIKLDQQHDLPNKICSRCILLLRAAFKFRYLCQQAQKQLEQFILRMPQKEDVSEELDCDAKNEMSDIPDEVRSALLADQDYVVEECIEEYDNIPSEEGQESVVKNNYTNVINDDIEIQQFSDDANSQYVVEEVEANECISEDTGDEITSYKVEEETTSDNVIIEEQPRKPKRQILINDMNKKKPKVKRKRKNNDHDFSGIYNCTFCDNTYTDKTKYTNHVKIHIKDKPHECEICRKRFSTTPQLSRHMNSHTGNRPYKCQYCEASFGDPSTKIKHERIHTNERPYKCSLCDKTFAYSNVLKVHMMTHTGEKPHTCMYCNRSFSQLHHKNSHEKRHTNINMVLLQNSTDGEYIDENDLKNFVDESIENINESGIL